MEIFKKISHARNYSVSSFGRVRNDKANRFLKLSSSGDKYLRVSLHGKKFRVHRLVAQAFVPNCKGFTHVHHKNGFLHDNSVTNLVWGNNGSLALRRDQHVIKPCGDAYKAEFQFRGVKYQLGVFRDKTRAVDAIISLKGLLSNICF